MQLVYHCFMMSNLCEDVPIGFGGCDHCWGTSEVWSMQNVEVAAEENATHLSLPSCF